MRIDSLRVMAGASIIGLSACADVAAVGPGHRAVLMTTSGAVSTLGEGVTDVPSDSVVHDFDLRQQTQGGTLFAITADGVPLVLKDPVLTWAWNPDELVEAQRTVGEPEGPGVVKAMVSAAVSRVLSHYRWDELNTAHVREAQMTATQIAAATLKPFHILLMSVDLKGLTPRLPGLARAVTETSVWEEKMASAPSRLELARQNADNLRAQASGIASANARLAPTLSPAVLQDKTDQALSALLASPHVTVQVSNVSSPVVEVSP